MGHMREKIERILHTYLDEPCDWCVNKGMDGKCMDNLEETCVYDIEDDAIEEITTLIIQELEDINE